MALFTTDNSTSVASLGEVALLRSIRTWLAEVSPPQPFGIGDDCAVIQTDPNLPYQIATTDGIILDRHFTQQDSPQDVGAKLLKRNISDIAAMGGTPKQALINIMLSRDTSLSWLEAFYKGLKKCAEAYQIKIIGGDIAELPTQSFVADMTLLGYGSNLKTRKTAKLNDLIFVTGELGGSALKKQFSFKPRLLEGQWLAQQPEVSAMMDLTDGLAKDLPELCQEPLIPGVHQSKLPISEDCFLLSKRTQHPPAHHAMTDGEDYELLFTLNQQTEIELFIQKWHQEFQDTSISIIGRIVETKEGTPPHALLDLDNNELITDIRGYEHLS